MHPVHGSDPRMTPFCAAEIKALRKCHETSGVMKFFNACNEDKIILNKCLSRDVSESELCTSCASYWLSISISLDVHMRRNK
jgi:hypothetical protein